MFNIECVEWTDFLSQMMFPFLCLLVAVVHYFWGGLHFVMTLCLIMCLLVAKSEIY